MLKPYLLSGAVPDWVLDAYSGAPIPSVALHYDEDRYWADGFGQGPWEAFHSITRASVKYATTKGGVLVPAASGVKSRTDNGLLIEGLSTNQLLYSRDFTQTAWVKVSMTAALTQVGVDGVANAASLLTATGGNATILQTLTIGSQAETFSVYLKRVSGSGVVNITENGGTNWTAAALTTEWQRFQVEATLANPVCGIQIVTSGDVIAADFAQDEEAAFATSPILTTGTTASRAIDNITLTGAALAAARSAKAARFVTNLVPAFSSNNMLALFGTSSQVASINFSSSTVVSAFNGTGSAQATLGSGTITGLVKTASGFDATSVTAIVNGGTKATAVEAWPDVSAQAIYLGTNRGSGNDLNGYMVRVAFGLTKGQFDALTTGSSP